MDINILKDSYYIMEKDLLALKRNRESVAALIILPIEFLLLFGYIFRSTTTAQHLPMGIVNLNNSQASSAFVTQIETMNKNSGVMNIVNYSSVEEAKTQIDRGNVYGTFIIPSGFSNNLTNGKSANVILYVDNSNTELSASVEGAASNTITGLNGMQAEINVIKMGSTAVNA